MGGGVSIIEILCCVVVEVVIDGWTAKWGQAYHENACISLLMPRSFFFGDSEQKLVFNYVCSIIRRQTEE